MTFVFTFQNGRQLFKSRLEAVFVIAHEVLSATPISRSEATALSDAENAVSRLELGILASATCRGIVITTTSGT